MAASPPACFDLSTDSKCLQPGSAEWNTVCRRICDALEHQGCFLVNYTQIPTELRRATFSAMETLFSLPEDAKRRIFGYRGPTARAPNCEFLAAPGAVSLDKARAVTQLPWPDHEKTDFSETMSNMSRKMLELARILMRMVFDGYGAEKYWDSYVGSSDVTLRMIRYMPPAPEKMDGGDHHELISTRGVGLNPHLDGEYLVIICRNEVQGLQCKSVNGEWIEVDSLQHPAADKSASFIVLAGHALRAWSNGRVHAPLHRVMVNGEKARLTCALFLKPKDDVMVEAPLELVDEKHPRLYKAFNYLTFRRELKVDEQCW